MADHEKKEKKTTDWTISRLCQKAEKIVIHESEDNTNCSGNKLNGPNDHGKETEWTGDHRLTWDYQDHNIFLIG